MNNRNDLLLRTWIVVLLAIALCPPAFGADTPLDMTLEELMQVEVTTASNHPQEMFSTPAAVYVITSEDIQRSTARNLPDLLRTVPGIEVAQLDANKWAISARGFNSNFANKLLVLIDGVSVYTPVFSGTYWSQDDLPLEEIERVEVIRGPGAAVWGSNAVNGVINVISKRTNTTSGSRIAVSGGFPTLLQGYVSHSQQMSESTSIRAWARGLRSESYESSGAVSADDDWGIQGGGVRADSRLAENQNLTMILKGYSANLDTVAQTYDSSLRRNRLFNLEDRGAGLTGLLDWKLTPSEDSKFHVTLWGTRSDRRDFDVNTEVDTYDLRAQHDLALSPELRFIYGVSARFSMLSLGSSERTGITFDHSREEQSIESLFSEIHYDIVPGTFDVSLGSKLEHHSLTGWGLQPNIRFGYIPAKDHFLWGAVSRALRVPAQSEVSANVAHEAGILDPNTGIPIEFDFVGHRDADTESTISYELGHRWLIDEGLSIDSTAFFTQNRGLTNSIYGVPGLHLETYSHFHQPLLSKNFGKVDTYGVEVALGWNPFERIRLRGGYTYFVMNTLAFDPALAPPIDEHDSPENRFNFQGSFEITEKLSLDSFYGFVGGVSTQDASAYHRFDLRLGYKVSPKFFAYITGQNLLEDSHEEYSSPFLLNRSEIPRGGVIGFDWTF